MSKSFACFEIASSRRAVAAIGSVRDCTEAQIVSPRRVVYLQRIRPVAGHKTDVAPGVTPVGRHQMKEAALRRAYTFSLVIFPLIINRLRLPSDTSVLR